MKSGIYQIRNTLDNKRYVGSAVNIKARLRNHLNSLRSNKHQNRRLQRAWNKYGEGIYRLEVLLFCNKENLLFYEQRAIDTFKSADKSKGYNICPVAGSNLGQKWSDEARERMKGRKPSKETLKKLSESHKGFVMPEEQKRKIAEALKGKSKPNGFNVGRKHSTETKHKISQTEKGKVVSGTTIEKLKHTFFPKGNDPWNKGKTGVYSEERLRKMSEIGKGRVITAETRRKLSKAAKGEKNPFFGRTHSEETRRKISETKRRKREQALISQ